MSDEKTKPPEVDTDLGKLAELANAEEADGVVDQQAAGAPKPPVADKD